MKKTQLSLIALSLFAANASAAGYMFPELGMMNISTAGAGAQAIAEGAETAFANPAAMSEFDSTAIAFNLQGMVSDIEYTDAGSTGLFRGGENSTQAGTAMPVSSFYLVQPINDKWTAGLAIASSGGSVIDYGPQFSGALLLQDAQLLTVQFNPSIAYQVQDNFSVGVGLVTEYGMLNQTLAGSGGGLVPQIDASGSSLEFGYTLSAFYKLDERNQFGFAYRSQIEHDMDGELKTRSNKVDSSVNIIMPATALLSGYHSLNEKVAAMWSLGWTDFSKISDTSISLTNREADIARNWEDTFSASVGMHYQLTEQWRLEGGVYYETSPQDDPRYQYPDVPTGEIWKFGTGASYDINKQWRMQMYYEYYYGGTPSIEYTLFEGSPAESTLRGNYDADIHFFGVLFNYQF